MQFRYATIDSLFNITSPVLLIHGTADRTIDIEHSRKLHRTHPKTFLVEAANFGHNNVYKSAEWLMAVPEFIQSRSVSSCSKASNN